MQKKSESKKKKRKSKQIYLIIQNRKKSFFGIFCVLISIFAISTVTFFSQTRSSMVGGLDICFPPEDEPQLTGEVPFIGLVPISDSNDIRVTISVMNVFEIYPKQIILYFPGTTIYHCMIRDVTDIELQEELQELQDIFQKTRIPISGQIDVIHDPSLNLDKIIMNPNQIEGFSGAIEFIWVNGVSQVDFATFRIDLPIRPLLTQEEVRDNCEFDKYEVQIWLWRGFERISSIPEISKYKKMEEMEYYVFEVDKTKTDFYVVFADKKAARYKDIVLIIASIFLGIGLTEIFEDVWVVGSKN